MPDDDQQDMQDQQEAPQQEADRQSETDDGGKGGKEAILADLARERKARQDFERELKVLNRTLEQERAKGLSEHERQLQEIAEQTRTSVVAEFGQALAKERFVALAAKRNPEFAASDVLDDLNLTRYLGEDGQPDTSALSAAVDRLVPAPVVTRVRGDAGQGARQSGPVAPDMNSLVRRLAGQGQ